MARTKVKLFLKDMAGSKDTLVEWINLPEQEAHDHYIGKRITVDDVSMKCYKVQTLKKQEAVKKLAVSPAI